MDKVFCKKCKSKRYMKTVSWSGMETYTYRFIMCTKDFKIITIQEENYDKSFKMKKGIKAESCAKKNKNNACSDFEKMPNIFKRIWNQIKFKWCVNLPYIKVEWS